MLMASTARPTGHPGYSETLPCDEASVGRARRLVRTALAAWGLDAAADDGSLIVSELVTNAVRHSGGAACRVIVTRHGHGRVRVAVTDRSRRMPDLLNAPADAVSGRGLALVDALADRWGTDRMHWGKRVWAELSADPSEPAQDDGPAPDDHVPDAGRCKAAHS
jgi:anti-sigma regulatory factor (Ser/Thr protein kinase)